MSDWRSRDAAAPSSQCRAGVSVVVPVYNGAPTVAELKRRIDEVLTGLTDWELILVVDGSPDDSWSEVRRLAESDPRVLGINLLRNFGQHNALLAGIRAASLDTIVTMDDDLQHRPETIPTLLDALGESVDLVYGHSDVEEHSRWRNLTSELAKRAMGASIGGDMARKSGAFRAFRTDLRRGFSLVEDPYVSIDVLLSWSTTRFTTAVTPMSERSVGSSNYTARSLVRHALNMVTGYSTIPLRLVSWIGFTLALLGAGALTYVLITYLTVDTEVPGFAFVASLVSILAGAQLFALGVIGEYLGRMHVRSMQRPPYAIREVVSTSTSREGGSS